MESLLPFLRGHRDEDPVVWRGDGPLTRSEFLHEAYRLAEALPDRPFALNLCKEHGRFMVGMAAALIRKQSCILPISRTPHHLDEILSGHPDSYFLRDEDEETFGVAEEVVVGSDRQSEVILRPPPMIPSAHLAVLIFSSGSTGKPKPNMKFWNSLVHVACITANRFGFDGGRRCSFVSTVPPYHMYGFEVTVMLPLWSGGAVYEKRVHYPEDIRRALESVPSPRVLVTTPSHLSLLTKSCRTLPELDMIISAAAPLSRDLCRSAEEGFNTNVYEIYGSTETGSLASRRTMLEDAWRPLDGIQLFQKDDLCGVTGSHLPAEIVLGDFVDIRPDGTFVLRGRREDMIKIAGRRASLGDLNFHLNAIPGVEDGIFFEPTSAEGEIVRLEAAVVAPNVQPKEILQALRQRVDSAFLPRRIHMLDSLPRNSTGKIPKEEILKLVSQPR